MRCMKKKNVFKCLIIFALTSWILVSVYDSDYNRQRLDVVKIGSELHSITEDVLFGFVKSVNGFVVDIDFLRDPVGNSTSSRLYFGVYQEYASELTPVNLERNGILCEVEFHYGRLRDEHVLTAVFIKCQNLRVQLSIFHKRGEFYWIGSGNGNNAKWFGDVDRAMSSFELRSLNDVIRVPSDVETFLYDYEHSRFIECNRELSSSKEGVDEKKEKDFLFGLRYIKHVLEGYRKHYWLAAGTLLGWYRECSIIQHTTDADIAMWSHEYEVKIKQHFLSNNDVRLAVLLGLEDEGYELRLFSKTGKTFDLFLMYKHNNTHQWNGYHIPKRLYRQWLPVFDKDNLCSGELLENKFIVPCNPEYYLSKQYGTGNWKTPKKNKYFNTDSLRFHREWSDNEWPYVVKRYNVYTHKLDVAKTLSSLNAALKEHPLLTLPYNDTES